MQQITSSVKFRQLISYDRSSDLVNGDLFVGMKRVRRAIMVVRSDQFEDRQFSLFITSCTALHGQRHPSTMRFEKLEDAIARAEEECKHHVLIGTAEYAQ